MVNSDPKLSYRDPDLYLACTEYDNIMNNLISVWIDHKFNEHQTSANEWRRVQYIQSHELTIHCVGF